MLVGAASDTGSVSRGLDGAGDASLVSPAALVVATASASCGGDDAGGASPPSLATLLDAVSGAASVSCGGDGAGGALPSSSAAERLPVVSASSRSSESEYCGCVPIRSSTVSCAICLGVRGWAACSSAPAAPAGSSSSADLESAFSSFICNFRVARSLVRLPAIAYL